MVWQFSLWAYYAAPPYSRPCAETHFTLQHCSITKVFADRVPKLWRFPKICREFPTNFPQIPKHPPFHTISTRLCQTANFHEISGKNATVSRNLAGGLLWNWPCVLHSLNDPNLSCSVCCVHTSAGTIFTWGDLGEKMGVSKNRGTPKWMVYNGKPY